MIGLTKGPEPDVLTKNAAAWTRELLACISRDETPNDALLGRYNHPEIKAALLNETSKKCAYCESFFRHVTYGDIEHIIAKKLAPELRYAWDNLTIACDVCNTAKGAKDQILDPYLADPSEFLFFFGPVVIAKPGNDIAMLTEVGLDLNRPELFERRAERIKFIRSLLELAQSKSGELREVLIRQANEEIAADCEYSAMGKTFLDSYLSLPK